MAEHFRSSYSWQLPYKYMNMEIQTTVLQYHDTIPLQEIVWILWTEFLYHRYILNQWVTSSSERRALPQGVLSRSSVYWNGPSTRRPIGTSFLSNPFIMILTTIKESCRKFGDNLKVNISLYVGFLLLETTALLLDFIFWPHEKYTTLT